MNPFPLPAFWRIANQFTGRLDWSELHQNLDWIDNPERIPDLPANIRRAFQNATPTVTPHPFITILDPAYPEKLRHTQFAPPVLFYQGNLGLLQKPMVAILGSRRCTQQGVLNSRILARQYADSYAIIGGLTAGIEYQSQRALLDDETKLEAPIVNITAQSIDSIKGWAAGHLQETLSRSGLVISEASNATPYRKWQYAQRNRIIAALSRTVYVVEAGESSGSLGTATMAAELGSEVWAIEHPTHARHGQGCNQLIDQGANAISQLDPSRMSTTSTILSKLNTPRSLRDIAGDLELSESDTLNNLLFWQQRGQVRRRGNLWERY